jgi:hypothetical protein
MIPNLGCLCANTYFFVVLYTTTTTTTIMLLVQLLFAQQRVQCHNAKNFVYGAFFTRIIEENINGLLYVLESSRKLPRFLSGPQVFIIKKMNIFEPEE